MRLKDLAANDEVIDRSFNSKTAACNWAATYSLRWRCPFLIYKMPADSPEKSTYTAFTAAFCQPQNGELIALVLFGVIYPIHADKQTPLNPVVIDFVAKNLAEQGYKYTHLHDRIVKRVAALLPSFPPNQYTVWLEVAEADMSNKLIDPRTYRRVGTIRDRQTGQHRAVWLAWQRKPT